MEKIKYYIEKYKIIILFIIVIVLTFAFLLVKNDSKEIKKVDNIELKKEEKNIEPLKNIKVDIKGFVLTPGVYELEDNSRIIDVINKAGGLLDGANTEYINLSKKITDEMIIIIYGNDEIEKFKEIEKEVVYIKYECECPDNLNDACINDGDVVNTNGNVEKENLISINNGTIEEFMTLKGIGEEKAKSIIEYREKNGKFENLEDIMNVSGIGEAAYSKIKDNIKL